MAVGQQTEVVNPVPVSEVDPWVRAMATTFMDDPGSESTDGWIRQLSERWDPQRAWGARDRGRWVATLRTEPRGLTVPAPAGEGAELPVDAVTNVTVAATHRRQGLMSRMLERSLQDARERGEALSVLIAAQWPIYGRFGYAPATLSCDYVLYRNRPGAHFDGDMAAMRQVQPEELSPFVAEVFDRARRQWAGQMDRSPDWWNRNLALDGTTPRRLNSANWLVHEDENGVDGILGWTPEGDPNLLVPEQRVVVQTLITASDAAYRDLWSYLARVDGIDQVQLTGRPVREPVRWLLTDGRALVPTRQYDFLWLRLLDPVAALRARTYAAPGDLVLEILDGEAGGFAAGRYALSVGEAGVAECEATNAPADLEIAQRALASIYLGGFRLAELAFAGGVRELRPGALARADLMFSWSRPPWNVTWF